MILLDAGRSFGTAWVVVVGEGFQRVAAFLVADLGDVKVADGVFQGGVTEVTADLEDGGSPFEHVGSEGVAQSVGGDVIVGARQSAFGNGDLDGLPNGRFAHGFGAAVHGLLDGQSGAFPSAADAREEPLFIAVKGPEFPQTHEHAWGDGDFARLAHFGLGDVDGEPLAVDVFGLDVDGFVQPKSALIDERAVGAIAGVAKGAQEPVDFVAREVVR